VLKKEAGGGVEGWCLVDGRKQKVAMVVIAGDEEDEGRDGYCLSAFVTGGW
jgi:hypothetical protein